MHCGPGPDDTTVVPKDTVVIMPGYAQHRSKRLWGEDANEWKPERWEGFAEEGSFSFNEKGEGREAVPHSVAYSALNPQSLRFHPFTRAPRDCFGKNFAQAEMRVVLPVLLSKFEFRLAEPTASQVADNPDRMVYQIAGILKPRDGLWMHAVPRDGAAATRARL
jgi:cytochrome P450